MSFILEALKKSEKKRQEGSAPRLETVLQAEAPVRCARPRWIWGLLALLLLNAGVLLWLFGPWDLSQTPAPAQVQAPVEPVAPVVDEEPTRSEILPAEPVAEPQTEVAPPVAAQSLPQEPVSPRPAPPVEPPVYYEPTPAVAPEPVSDPEPQAVLAINQLPRNLRDQLPPMHMSVHAYNADNAAASLVRINDKILRVGALLDGKYELDEISADGAVFRYSGYRFLVPRKNLRN